MEQLSFSFDFREELKKAYKNYNWLMGNPANLKIAFREELQRKDLTPELRADAQRRLDELEKGYDSITEAFMSRLEGK